MRQKPKTNREKFLLSLSNVYRTVVSFVQTYLGEIGTALSWCIGWFFMTVALRTLIASLGWPSVWVWWAGAGVFLLGMGGLRPLKLMLLEGIYGLSVGDK